MESLGVLGDAVERAREITDKLLTFAQSHPSRVEVMDLRFWVMDLRSFLERITGESVELRLELPRGPWPVRADRTQLDQVLLNLAANARDAMPRGGELVIRLRRVTLEEATTHGSAHLEAGPYICVECQDSGEGISPESMRRVLEPFFTTRSRGSGLGLSTAYGILRSHQGALELESEPGQGTLVRVYLPQSDRVSVLPSNSGHGLLEEPPGSSGEDTVMVVESEQAVRRFILRVLLNQEFSVLEARDGAEALQKLEQRQGRVGMVLADLQGGQPHHLELLEQIKHRWPQIKVVLVSGFHQGEVADHPTLGSLPFLRKPFLPSQLISTVRAAWAR
jgi:two-component system cell cycle sensor histidine kinase/response regulator CckA